MLAQMFTIAGGILLAIFILAYGRLIVRTALVLIAVGAVLLFLNWIGPSLPPKDIVMGGGGTLALFALLVYFVYQCYKEFMKGWRDN